MDQELDQEQEQDTGGDQIGSITIKLIKLVSGQVRQNFLCIKRKKLLIHEKV